MSLPARTSLPAVGVLVLGLLLLGPAGAAGAANGQVCMGVVIDDGSSNPTTQSAQVAPGTSDLQSMSAAGDTATQNNSGLVCAINNFPANGLDNCLSTAGNGQYFYWSYWHGDPYTNTWTYANDGPASHTVSAGQTYVEGWRYQNPGPDSPAAPKPSVSPATAFAQACPGVTPVPAGTSGGSGGAGGGSASGGGGSAGPGVGSSPATIGSPTAPASPGVPGTGAAPGSVAGGTTSSGNGTTTTAPPGPGAANLAQGTSTTTTAGKNQKHHDAKTETALADPRGHSGPGGGGDPTLPIVIVVLVILALGGLAWLRWRRRPLEE